MTYRILHCLRAPVGGLFRHVRDLTAAQAGQGHDVGVICDAVSKDSLTEPRLIKLSQHLSLDLTRIPMSRTPGAGDLAVVKAATRLACDKSINIIHGHGAKGGAYARLAARSLRRAGHPVKCIYTPHGGSLHYAPTTVRGRIYATMERYLASHTDAIAFESAFSLNAYSNQIGPPSCRTAVIPNGLLPGEFDPILPAPSASDLLFVGELRHLKGVDVLLLALQQVRQNRAVSATIVGAGPDAAQFKSLCSQLRLDDTVTFPGALPAREAFKLGKALFMPSRAESFPYIILEAAAAGLPIYASNVGGIPEIVAGTDTDLLPPADVPALARAIERFLANPAAARQKADRLKQQVASQFTVAAMAGAIDRLYASA